MWTSSPSSGASAIYANPEFVMKGIEDDRELLNFDDEVLAFKKEERVATIYHPSLFEWTHYRAKVEPSFMLILVKKVLE